MQVSGSCHCGAITIEAEAIEDYVVLCYCTDCQTFSGSVFRGAAMVLRETMTVMGAPRTYVKVSDSGLHRLQAFCPDCGTALYSDHTEEHTPYVSLRLGFLDQREQLTPKVRTWRRSAPRWSDGIDRLPSLQEQDFSALEKTHG